MRSSSFLFYFLVKLMKFTTTNKSINAVPSGHVAERRPHTPIERVLIQRFDTFDSGRLRDDESTTVPRRVFPTTRPLRATSTKARFTVLT
jgi:hypothetical protein